MCSSSASNPSAKVRCSGVGTPGVPPLPLLALANTLPHGPSPSAPVTREVFQSLASKPSDSQPSAFERLVRHDESVLMILWREVLAAMSSWPTRPATLPSFHPRTAMTLRPTFRCFFTSTVRALFQSPPASTFLPLINASKPLSHDIVNLADCTCLAPGPKSLVLSRTIFRKKIVSFSFASPAPQIQLGFSAAVVPVAVMIISPATMAKLPPVRFCRKDMAANGSDLVNKRQQKEA